MPWSSSDVDRFIKGLDTKQKHRWVSIANSVLASCLKDGGNEKRCAGRAIHIANSKFQQQEEDIVFNPVLDPKTGKRLMDSMRIQNVENINLFNYGDHDKAKDDYDMDGMDDAMKAKMKKCMDEGNGREECMKMLKSKDMSKFQYTKTTPPDPQDGHTHKAAYDEDGNGGTSSDGSPEHTHTIWNFKVQPYYYSGYTSVHPGSIAFNEDGEAVEMEIFRVGTHNGDEFTEKDLQEIADNFGKLKDEVRPKLKITHRENQESLGGLASYGDVVEVFLKKVSDGSKRLFAKVSNIPKQVADFIKERRFPERSIELYPKFKLGVKEDSPVYKNVLKAIALLGHEMPAVTGMAPVKLEECLECQGTRCFREQCDIKTPITAKVFKEINIFESCMNLEIALHEMRMEGIPLSKAITERG